MYEFSGRIHYSFKNELIATFELSVLRKDQQVPFTLK